MCSNVYSSALLCDCDSVCVCVDCRLSTANIFLSFSLFILHHLSNSTTLFTVHHRRVHSFSSSISPSFFGVLASQARISLSLSLGIYQSLQTSKISNNCVFPTMSSEPVAKDNKDFDIIDNVVLVNVKRTGVSGLPSTTSVISGIMEGLGAKVLLSSQDSSKGTVCFVVYEKEVDAVAAALESRFQKESVDGCHSKVEVIPNCSILSAVDQEGADSPGVGVSFINAQAKENVNVLAIAQGGSETTVTVVLKKEDCTRALQAFNSRFYLSKTTIAMGIVGPGLIGATLLDQIRDQAAILKKDFDIDLRVMGIIGSTRMILSDLGIDLSRWRELQKEKGEVADMEKFTQHVHGNQFIGNTILVDCTADSNVASLYYEWLRRGIHVITPNKKANSGPLDQLRALQRQSYTHYFYEATVGAGLPIISTLRGLQETGDKILRIEGIFSGTLSYIFNSFIGERAFSEVVREAKQAGYTEPDPRDDLSGTDVARKVIILARESGLKLELSDVPVQSLVPEPLQVSSSAEQFMQQLPQFDQDVAKKRHDAEAAGEVLRYVGVVDVVNQKGSVELRRYKKDHPFARLSGSDNIISFTTTRYKDHPLIIIGPGAGAQVTAGGVFGDVVRVASYLGAPS
ncbi:hypothetical protein AQUCO_01700092v1 [Aquilegia coerulea]|uniref:Homoserine dehydrogenase n=1 Tax=Aquilegia coerulea TaxID=218851 RepID=A0A2G5DL62_AQUCA|nr:hypothetical protein AQUCO_01700092v1 [Aquilegia coerulea]